jgi:hypothetical protein
LPSKSRVLQRKHDKDGNPVGRDSTNPILDTRVYEMQFSDGHIEEYAAYVIAEKLYSQVDEDGNHLMLLHELIDHCKGPDALSIEDMWETSNNGNHVPK